MRESRGGSRGSARRRSAIRFITSTASTGNSPTAVSPESMIAEVPSRIAFATSDASARVGSGWWIIDSSICVAVITGLPRSSARAMIRFCSSGTSAAPISTPRSPRATMTASDSARISSSAAIASAFSILAITWAVRAARLDQRAQRAHVRGRADERQRDEVDAELQRKLEVVDVLARERRDRERDAGQVDALVRRDDAADHHFASRPAALDRLDPELDVTVVDQHFVAYLEYGSEHGGADRQVALLGRILARDDDGGAACQRDGSGEISNAKLRALQVRDQCDRPAGRRLGLAHTSRPGSRDPRGCRATC